MKKFPKEIEDFGSTFIELQSKRHDADYNPLVNFKRSDVLADVDMAEEAILQFKKAPLSDRRAFAAFVLLKSRFN